MRTTAAKCSIRRRAAIALLILLVPAVVAAAERHGVLEAASRLGAEVFVDPISGGVCFTKDGKTASFRPGSRIVLFDGKPSLLESEISGNPPVLEEEIFSRLYDFFAPPMPSYFYKVGAVLIDPGHGGKDPGSSGSYSKGGKTVTVREKDVVLSTAKMLRGMLARKYPDKKILLTREGDTYPSLEERVSMANSVELESHEAVIYVSIHANAAFNKSSSGFEVWYLSPDYRRTVIDGKSVDSAEIVPILNSMMEEEFTTESILIAQSVLEGLEAEVGNLSNNRGLKAESWFVVRNARMPSVLIELGFVTNEDEARLLDDRGYLQKCASGIYNGIVNFVSYFEGIGGTALR